MSWLASIGLECHVQLKTKTKLFTGVSNQALEAEPGTLIGPLCLGLPGTLPVVNQQALEYAVLAGLALNAEIADFTRFDRKHYFYPDLPLGYQITQHEYPIVKEGLIEFETKQGTCKVRLIRAHLEADAGKLSHLDGSDDSLLDLNRVGTPLLEIVSYPDIHSPADAKQYAREIALRMRYAGVSDCDMYAGNLRFDANVSLSKDKNKLGTRTELKNLNSFRNLERALTSEIARQTKLLEAAQTVTQETRGWNETTQETFAQRSKEEAHDYRYMPDPDIPPVVLEPSLIKKLKQSLPATPPAIRQILKKLELPSSISETILDYPEAANLVLKLVETQPAGITKTIANWLAGEILRWVSAREVSWASVTAAEPVLVLLAELVDVGKLSSTQAKSAIANIIQDPVKAKADLVSSATQQISDESALLGIIDKVFEAQPKAVADAKVDPKAIGFLVGQVMKLSNGQANPKLVDELIRNRLK